MNGFTLEGAIALGGDAGLNGFDTVDLLTSLIDKSLVLTESDGNAIRYRLHESMHVYAREQLQAADELLTSVTRHRRYLRDLFADALTRFEHSGRSADIDALLLTELEGVRFALDGITDKRAWKTGAELLAAVDNRWKWIGLSGEGAALLERFIASYPVMKRCCRHVCGLLILIWPTMLLSGARRRPEPSTLHALLMIPRFLPTHSLRMQMRSPTLMLSRTLGRSSRRRGPLL